MTLSIPPAPRKPEPGAPLPILAALVAVSVLGAALIVVGLSRSSSSSGSSDSASVSDASQAGADLPVLLVTPSALAPAATAIASPGQGTPPAATPTATADASAAAPASAVNLQGVGSGDRLIISKLGVNAPLSYHVVGSDGQMPNPDGEDDVAYYNFSNFAGFGGAPGKGGNAVFAGHVDSGFKACSYGTVPPPCEAVLWSLNKVNSGDEIDVKISDVTYRYSVTSTRSVLESSDWGPIVSATAQESITVITCGGDFNPTTHTYDSRQVVKATRIGG